MCFNHVQLEAHAHTTNNHSIGNVWTWLINPVSYVVYYKNNTFAISAKATSDMVAPILILLNTTETTHFRTSLAFREITHHGNTKNEG